MYARLLALATRSDACWDSLVSVYHEDYRADDVALEIAKKHHEVFVEPKEEIVKGSVRNESSGFILTWEDGMDETMRLYERIN